MPTGYILQRNKDRVVIATLESENAKTGDMIQVWILPVRVSPVEAVKTGYDRTVCGDCKFAHGQGCYVNVGQAPSSVWRGFHRGIYPVLKASEYSSVFAGRMVRLGAYGDPVYIAPSVIARITRTATGWTGYTHAWQRADWLKPYAMASADTLTERTAANAAGWRTFRPSADGAIAQGEIMCPSERGIHCVDCGLCNGAHGQKDITLPVHGSRSARALVQIGTAQ